MDWGNVLEPRHVLRNLQPAISHGQTYLHGVRKGESLCVVEESMQIAREEVRELTGTPRDDVTDVLVSYDGTWQKRGFSSFSGVVFVIAHVTGKVIGYQILSILDASIGIVRTKLLLSTEHGRRSMNVKLILLGVLQQWSLMEHWHYSRDHLGSN